MGDATLGDSRRGRPPAPLVDRTALDGPAPDVAARVAWVLRFSRLALRPDLLLRDLVALLGEQGVAVSESTLSRLETGRLRSGPLVDAYERALGLPPASLRAPLDIVCRTYGVDPGRDPGDPCIAAVTEALSPVLDADEHDEIAGAQWLAFADAVARPDGALVPSGMVRGAIHRLARELRRSVGHAAPARYEALALLRTSRYAQVVLDIGLELLLAPSAPPQAELARSLGELPCRPLFQAVARELPSSGLSALEGLATGLETAKAAGGAPRESWELLIDPLLETYRASAGQPWRRMNLGYMVRLLPGDLRIGLLERLGERPPDPLRSPMDWSSTRRNEHLSTVTRTAAAITAELGLPEQPMLARLLFEGLYDPRASREHPAAQLLGALPFSPVVVRHLVDLHASTTDAATRGFVPWLLMRMKTVHAAPLVRDWLGPDNRGVSAALLIAYGGAPLSLDDVRPHLDGPGPHRDRALVALGLAGSLPAGLADGLAADGPRIVD